MRKLTSNRLFNLPALLMLCMTGALMVVVGVRSEAPRGIKNTALKRPMRMFDVGLGPHTFKFQAGRDNENHYLGSSSLQQALQSGDAQPRSMVADDFNGDSMGDLVAGYASSGGGIISLRAGNLQAISPTDPEVFAGMQQGRYPAPFLPEAKLYSLLEAPDFLKVGDFNSDGYSDVIAAARYSQALYVLAGDGRGNLGAPERVELPGSLTALQAYDSKQPGVFTPLALGLRTIEGTKAFVYNQSGGGLSGTPEVYSMPSDVTAFAFGTLDDDVNTDLAVAAGDRLMVIHGREDRPAAEKAQAQADALSSGLVETESVSFAIRGIVIGDFVWDRNHQREIALLSDDGSVYLSARGNPDTRPYTAAEKKALRDLKRAYSRDQIDMETLIAETNKFVRANYDKGWNVKETISTGVSPVLSVSGEAIFQRADVSDLPTDGLLVGNGFNKRLQLVRNEADARKLDIRDQGNTVNLDSLSADSPLVAAVSMRLGVDTRSGVVVLKSGSVEPESGIITPDATFNVNSTLDAPDDNPLQANGVCHTAANTCTLRAAVMQSNHTGGSNTIMLPAGTYTLTVGPPDDDANLGGAVEDSGDLDIFSWAPYVAMGGDPTAVNLTAVNITGPDPATTIIQMGNLSPILGTNSPNNKERMLCVNDMNSAIIPRRVNVTLTNLTLQNGIAPTSGASFINGGAIFFDGSDTSNNTNLGLLTLNNVKVTANTAAGSGAGVHAQFGSLKLENNTIIRANTAQHKVGGGVEYNGGNTVESQFLAIDNSTIGGALVADGNLATDTTFGAGAGLDTRGGGTGGTFNGIVIQNNTIIRNNVASSITGLNGGGGIQINNGPVFAFSNSTISNNSAKLNGGGLLSNATQLVAPFNNATVTLTTMTITANSADSDTNGSGDGGGIYNFAGSLVLQTNTHVDGNTAFNGGGIASTWNGGTGLGITASLSMNGGTIGQAGAGNGNSARNNGGGFWVDEASAGSPGSFGTITLTTASIVNNTANSDSSAAPGGDGGGVFVGPVPVGWLSTFSGPTIDSNVANGAGATDGIRLTGGAITLTGTATVSNGDSVSMSAGTFTSTTGTFNLSGSFSQSGGTFAGSSGTINVTGNVSLTGGTFTSTSGALNLSGNFTNSGATFTHNSGTVNFIGAGAQSLLGTTNSTFNNLTINNASGVSTVSETVAGTLTLTSGLFAPAAAATLTLNGPVSFTGGSFNANATSTVNYAKTSNLQNIVPGQYGNLTFSNFTKQLPAGTVKIAGAFTTGAAGGHTVAGSTVEFNGTALQTLPAGFTTYDNLTINNSVGATGASGLIVQSLTRVMLGTFTANNSTLNNVQIDASRTLAGVAATTINVSGNWTNNGTLTPNGNTVVFNGNNNTQTITGTNTFNNLTINHTGTGNVTSTGSTLTVGGLLRVQAGTFICASTLNNVQIDSGATLQSDGNTMNVAGNWTNNGGTFTHNNNTVNFNGAGAQSIGGTSTTQTFFNFTVNKSGGSTLSVAASTTTLNIANNLLLTAGNFAAGTATTINVALNWTNNSGTTAFNGGSGTVIFNGSSAQTIGGTFATTFNNLTINNAAGVSNSLAGLTVTGLLRIQGGTFTTSSSFNNVQIDSGTTLAANPASTINVSGNWTNNGGTFTPSTGTVNFNGGGAQSIGGTATTQTFNNFTVNKSGGSTLSVIASTTTLDINGTVTLTAGIFSAGTATSILAAGDWTNNGGTFTPGSGTVTFDGGAAQNINGSAASQTFNNITVNKGGGTLAVGGSTTTLNLANMSLNAGTFDNGAATVNVSGNWTNNGATFNPTAGTVVFNSAVAGQSIDGTAVTQSFFNLTVTKTGQTLSTGGSTTTLDVNGAFALTAGTFTAPPSLLVAGNFTQDSGTTFTPGSGTVTFDGSGVQNIQGTLATKVFNNFTVNKSGNTLAGAASTTALDINGNVTITAGTFAAGTAANINVFGDWSNSGTFTGGTGTVIFDGNNNTQTLSGNSTFNNLTINHTGTGGVTAAGSTLAVTALLRIQAGTFTSASSFVNVQIDVGTTLAGTNATTMNVSGNWTNNGTFTPNGNTVNFNGNNNTQTITGATAFDNLQVSHTGTGDVTLASNISVNTLATFTSGVLSTAANSLSMGAAATRARTSGYVIGNEKKTFGGAGAFIFDVGTANGYSPVDVNVTAGAGDLTIKATQGPQPNVSAATSLQRYWTLTEGGGITADVVFHYIDPTDIMGTEANYRIIRVSGGTPVSFANNCPSPCVDTTNNTGTINGLSEFSDWTLGENITPTATNGVISGQIVDSQGHGVEGVAVRMNGTQTRLTVTDATGNYRFDNVEINGLYVITPSRVNFTFGPTQRSFTQLGLQTDAAFTATANGGTLNPLDTTEYFVRQQYVDFLGREPDESGFNFWVNNIESCGADVGCREVKRIDTSAAFFLSIEFQQTGYIVYRTYKSAYNDLPNTPVPLTLAEFRPDTAQIGNGVIVLQNGWQDKLESNKQAFMTDFVQRSRFLNEYPLSLTPSAFVTKLFSNAGVSTSEADYAAAVSEFGGAADTANVAARARALRRIAENTTLDHLVFNRAFVLMEYFGYLRRDANSGQDSDFAGYNFWLDKLNTFNGNFRDAQMVKAFLTSIEYRGRFTH